MLLEKGSRGRGWEMGCYHIEGLGIERRRRSEIMFYSLFGRKKLLGSLSSSTCQT
jgi:hypothetical protein